MVQDTAPDIRIIQPRKRQTARDNTQHQAGPNKYSEPNSSRRSLRAPDNTTCHHVALDWHYIALNGIRLHRTSQKKTHSTCQRNHTRATQNIGTDRVSIIWNQVEPGRAFGTTQHQTVLEGIIRHHTSTSPHITTHHQPAPVRAGQLKTPLFCLCFALACKSADGHSAVKAWFDGSG